MKPLSLLFIGILFGLSACQTPFYVSVPLKYAPTSYFKKDTTTIVVINRFDMDNLKIDSKQKLSAMKAGALTAIKAVTMKLGSLRHIKTICLADTAGFKTDTGSIKTIAQKYKADYVLALTSYDSGVTTSSTPSPTISYDIYASVNFLLYEGNCVYYKKLNGTARNPETNEQYTALTTAGFYNQNATQNGAPVNSAVGLAAQDALKEYFPYTVTYKRPMYDDDFLLPAIRQIQTSNYAKADSILRPFIRDSNRVRAGKAYYALAVVKEAKGDFGVAIDLARLALKMDSENEYAPALLDDLQQVE